MIDPLWPDCLLFYRLCDGAESVKDPREVFMAKSYVFCLSLTALLLARGASIAIMGHASTTRSVNRAASAARTEHVSTSIRSRVRPNVGSIRYAMTGRASAILKIIRVQSVPPDRRVWMPHAWIRQKLVSAADRRPSASVESATTKIR